MRPFYRFAYNCVGLHLKLFHHIRVEGRENIPDGGCLIVVNHASFLDPTTAGWAIPREIYYLGRKSLFKPPFWSWFLPICNVLPIDRDGGDISGLRGIIKMLRDGHSVLLFPEGTRSPDGTLQPAEGGAGFIALKAGVPVLPIRLFGTHACFPRQRKFPRPGPIRIVVGQAYQPRVLEGKTERQSYGAVAQEMMARIAALT